MLVEAVFLATAGDIPMVRPKNLVQFTLHILIVFPSAIENTVEETTQWPLKCREIHFGGWNARHISLAFRTVVMTKHADVTWYLWR